MSRCARLVGLLAITAAAVLCLRAHPAATTRGHRPDEQARVLASQTLTLDDTTDIDDATPDDGGVDDAGLPIGFDPRLTAATIVPHADVVLPVSIAAERLPSRGPPRA